MQHCAQTSPLLALTCTFISQSVSDMSHPQVMINGEQATLNFIITVITHGCNSHSTLLTLLGVARLAWTRHTNKYAFLLFCLQKLKWHFMCASFLSIYLCLHLLYQRTSLEIYLTRYKVQNHRETGTYVFIQHPTDTCNMQEVQRFVKCFT